MMVVGFDPGTRLCGWAVARIQAGHVQITDSGCFLALPKWDLDKRLRHMHDSSVELLERYKPKLVAIEGGFVKVRREQATMALGEVRGAIKAAAWKFNAETEELAPATGKKALTGSGKAQKDDMVRWAKLRFGLTVTEEDQADAVGIALASAERLIARSVTTERNPDPRLLPEKRMARSLAWRGEAGDADCD